MYREGGGFCQVCIDNFRFIYTINIAFNSNDLCSTVIDHVSGNLEAVFLLGVVTEGVEVVTLG